MSNKSDPKTVEMPKFLKEQRELTRIQRKNLEIKKAKLIGFKKDKGKYLDNTGKELYKVHLRHINEQLKGNKPSLKEVAKKVLGKGKSIVLKKLVPLAAFLASSPAYKKGGVVKRK
tara:strand:+ start:503 stop:850 length:348 start_codon:yes stop_codon:yes gene_type:complete